MREYLIAVAHASVTLTRWILGSPALFFAILALSGTVVSCASAHAERTALQPGDVRGAYLAYNWSTGKFAWEPFIKIAYEKGAPSESGELEIWGFRPWNLEPPKKDGKTYPVNILASHFIPCDGQSHDVRLLHPNEPERVVERKLRCPEILWP